ncbi:GIY-YIG nuclease family protein [Patescibacteria group bacterium]|nr:GIY-YIG nuclease family protein [Patescibacteria group bacterium]
MKIQKQLKNITQSPGVYIFRDKKNKILYIGKAKNLRSRVRSYFINNNDNRPFLPRIVIETAKIETIKVNSEVEAILLEAKLIKKIKPPYNARQKDDKSFIYIFINFSDPVPQVQFIRQKEVLEGRIKQRKRDKLFGPFLSAFEMKKLLNYFRLIIPYRDCRETKFNKYQKLNRGCQWAELDKCPAPCVKESNKIEYRKNVSRLSRLLSGKIESVKKDLLREMKRFSKEKNYEKAAEIRDRIKTLDHIKEMSLITDDLHFVVYTSEVKYPRCMVVEAVDISNISGKYASGSVVAAEYQISNLSRAKSRDIKFLKERYRRFKIKIKDWPDDVAMIREVIKRRFKHPEWKFPDLLVIDGGRGQIKAAVSELKKLKIKLPVVSIAKGPTRRGEELFFSRNFEPKLKSTLKACKRVIKLMRDEAHRFAISYHKILRRKGIIGK